MDKVKGIVNAPGNVLNAACNGAKTVFNGIVDTGKKIGNFFKGLFGKRKKRSSGCGIQPAIPDVDIKVPGWYFSSMFYCFYF